MMTLLVLLCIQAQEPTIDDRIAAFLKGDPAARAHLMELGAFAIRPLQKARDRGPEKIDALVLTLKKAAAQPPDSPVFKDLESPNLQKAIESLDVKTEHALPTLQALVPFAFLDLLKPDPLKSKTFSLKYRVPTQVRTILDDLCFQTGLDYGVFHNHLVVALPDRLWPSGPPEAPKKLTDEESARARKLIEKLAAEAIEDRESASRELQAMGLSVLPLLRETAKSAEPEAAARCASLIKVLEPRPRGAFGPPAADGRAKTPADEAALKQLQSMKMALDFQNARVADMVGYLREFSGIQIQARDPAGSRVPTFRLKNASAYEALCLMTQMCDLDFLIRDGKVVIDTRKVIQDSAGVKTK